MQYAVICPGDRFFTLECGGPDGVPLACNGSVKGNSINDFFELTSGIYASSREEAATCVASGTCTNRLDCRSSYDDGVQDTCICGADVESLGFSTCEDAAASLDGQLVDICPRYEPDFESITTCWPPPCE